MKKHDFPYSSSLEVTYNKIQSKESLLASSTTWQKFFGKNVVFTHICFDMLHHGIINYLAKAKDLGNELIVAISSDESLKRFCKNSTQHFQNEQTRALLLASLHFVSAVVIFDEPTPANLINFLIPNVLVMSAHFDVNETNPTNEKYIPGSDAIRANGGEVITIELL